MFPAGCNSQNQAGGIGHSRAINTAYTCPQGLKRALFRPGDVEALRLGPCCFLASETEATLPDVFPWRPSLDAGKASFQRNLPERLPAPGCCWREPLC